MHRLATLLAIGSLPGFLLLPLAEAVVDDGTCLHGTCLPAMPVRDFALLESCLSAAFDRTKLLPRVQGGRQVQKITYPQDGEAYFHARGEESESSYRLPAAVFIAENEEDVKSAVKCATSAGYKISPRGRRHQSQGLSSMDGYVVIDCHLLCDPDSFVLERSNEDWLLPGQKLVGTIKSGSGCTNAVMLAYTHKNFDPTEGALYAIGTCPSVGITGYTTGGGAGDVTPYTGWGADDLLEVDIVLYNGTKVTANKIEHPDLLWAAQGGGGGFGVITSLTTAVVQSPEPPEGANRKFTYFYNLNYLMSSREAILQALQDYLYEADPLESSRFGGGGNFLDSQNLTALQGVFLGSIEEFVANFQKHGLLNASQMNTDLATPLMRNYEEILPSDFPPGLPAHGFSKLAEFNSYGEAILWALCTGVSNHEIIVKTQTTGDVCADLNITGDKCTDFDLGEGFSILVPNCDDPDVIKAMADAALNPFSFFNNVGPNWEVWGGYGLEEEFKTSSSGGILIPKVDLKTLNELAKIGLKVNHFQHGAPMTRSSDATAFPWRDAAIMTGVLKPQARDQFASVLAEFYGDETKLQGYYNYMNPAGNPNWRYYYFGDNHPRLASIKSVYDPLNYFGNPLQIEPAVEPTSTKQEKEEPVVEPTTTSTKQEKEDKSSSVDIGPSIALASVCMLMPVLYIAQ